VKLIYITNMSLDGYIEDSKGRFDWGNADQIFDFITGLMKPIGTHLLGRRLYETMVYWESPVEGFPPEQREFACVWQRAMKIVYSRTLAGASAHGARIEREFDPDAIRKLKLESTHDMFIGGAELAGRAFESGLVDECHLFVHPVIVGGGKPAFQPCLREELELLETRRFDSGVIHAHYRVKSVGT
jgi:dihydrofolate reductase